MDTRSKQQWEAEIMGDEATYQEVKSLLATFVSTPLGGVLMALGVFVGPAVTVAVLAK